VSPSASAARFRNEYAVYLGLWKAHTTHTDLAAPKIEREGEGGRKREGEREGGREREENVMKGLEREFNEEERREEGKEDGVSVSVRVTRTQEFLRVSRWTTKTLRDKEKKTPKRQHETDSGERKRERERERRERKERGRGRE
jgi:hypothetical protein